MEVSSKKIQDKEIKHELQMKINKKNQHSEALEVLLEVELELWTSREQ